MIKYRYRKYKFYYPFLFNKEEKFLKKFLPNEVDIEHVGSTSVKGLGGKGIIDILISCSKKKIEDVKVLLIKNKYIFGNDKDREERFYFHKYRWFLGEYRVHVHLTHKGSKIEKQALLFRDNLRKSKELKDKYSKIKKKAIKFAKEDGEKYKEFKSKVIQEILNKK